MTTIPFLADFFGGGPKSAVSDLSRVPFVSPLSPQTELDKLVWEDMLGVNERPPINTRSAAMRLGPIIRGRNLICGSIAPLPLVAIRGDRLDAAGNPMVDADGYPVPNVLPAAETPWLYATEDGSTWQHRTLWTVDDLIFHGWSLWHRRLGFDRFPLAATHVRFGDWFVDDDNRLNVGGFPVENSDEWLLIPGLHEGILNMGGDILRDARDLICTVRERVENNAPPLTLAAQAGAESLTPEEIDAVIASYKAARKRNGGVGYTNQFLKPEYAQGNNDADLLVEARNAAAVDLARLIGIHAGQIDATAPKASLNYETATGRNQEFTDTDMSLYMWPITARCSLDDMVPHGQRVGFDARDYTRLRPTNTGIPSED